MNFPVPARTAQLSLTEPTRSFSNYAAGLSALLGRTDWATTAALGAELADCARSRRRVFICGNGGSAANASHLANDFIYGVAKCPGRALRVTSLAANAAVISCLANDEGYERVFEIQLAELADRGDVLIVLSGSGNSPNILRALEAARRMGLRSFAILGFDGGLAKSLADVPIHFPVDDMQMAEDMQVIVGHMIMQWLWDNRAVLAEEQLRA